jgi:hypothetical protein
MCARDLCHEKKVVAWVGLTVFFSPEKDRHRFPVEGELQPSRVDVFGHAELGSADSTQTAGRYDYLFGKRPDAMGSSAADCWGLNSATGAQPEQDNQQTIACWPKGSAEEAHRLVAARQLVWISATLKKNMPGCLIVSV